MSLYKRGNYWWISMWRNGKHIQVSTKLKEKRMARAVEQALGIAGRAKDGSGKDLAVGTNKEGDGRKELILGLLRSVYGDDGDKTSLTELWQEYLDVFKVKGKIVTPKNLQDKKSCLDAFVEWASGNGVSYISQVDGSVAQKYALKLAKGSISAKRRKNIILHMSAVWNAVLPNHKGIVNPWPVVSPSNVQCDERRIFTPEEERRILSTCQQIHPQWYVASMIARHTGLRYGDVCRLTYAMIDMSAGIISLCPHKTKNSSGVSVSIPISSPLRKVLSEWYAINPRWQPSDRVLPWLREYGPKHDKRFSTVLVKAGLDPKKYSFHTWRHCFRSALSRTGATTEVAMKLCGHTTQEMSARYDHTQILPDMRDAVERASAG